MIMRDFKRKKVLDFLEVGVGKEGGEEGEESYK